MCRGMESEHEIARKDLIAQLCLEAGRIMEDESLRCALALPTHEHAQTDYLGRIARAGEDIAKLAAAAQVLHRRFSTTNL